jgi:ATP-dependent DNA ligase
MGYADRDFRKIRLLAPPYARTILVGSTRYTPMPLAQRREPFDHQEWIYELKYGGFRALLSTGGGPWPFISRKADAFSRFSNLALFIARKPHAHAAARWLLRLEG